MFDLKKLQQEQRSQKVAEFGQVGFKTDCKYYADLMKGASCAILHEPYCKSEVCHFYCKRVNSHE